MVDLSKIKRGIEEAMPHLDGKEIIDKVHPFKTGKPTASWKDLNDAISEIDWKEFSRFVGLVGHLCYWSVFGHIN